MLDILLPYLDSSLETENEVPSRFPLAVAGYISSGWLLACFLSLRWQLTDAILQHAFYFCSMQRGTAHPFETLGR